MIFLINKNLTLYLFSLAGADPGFCVRGDESRRGVWGPFKVSSGVQGRALVGGPGGAKPSSSEAPGF